MDLKINGGFHALGGEVSAPSSKSYSHRAFIIAGIANGVSIIQNPLTTGDVGVTLDFLRDLGVKITKVSESAYSVSKDQPTLKQRRKALDCKNSGTTIRIFTALSLIVSGGLTFTGYFLQKNRPILPLLKALESLGAKYTFSKNSLHVERKQEKCNTISIPGDISSQFITALLITCPLLTCKNSEFIEIKLTTPLISFPYIKITEEVLTSFGGHFDILLGEDLMGSFELPINQNLRSQDYKIPGDFSSAAFLICAAVLASKNEVIINNLDFDKPQGDKAILDILLKMGANLEVNKNTNQVIIKGNIDTHPLEGIDIDCKNIPDLFPILSVMGTQARGTTTLYNAFNLRLKESDRISAMSRELKKMGANLVEEQDKMIIKYSPNLKGSLIHHDNDHRVAMACVIAALKASSSSIIKNSEIINDSYPQFIEDLVGLGAKIEII